MEAGHTGLNKDTWTGILGAALLIAAMTGVFLYERGQFREYDVTWTPVEAGSEETAGTLDAGADASHTVTIEVARLSQVRAALTWTDGVGAGDTFQVAVSGPGGSFSDSQEGDDGRLEVTVPVNEAPAATTATGRSTEDAADQLQAQASGGEGQGTWTVTVTLVSAPGDALPGGVEVQADGTNDYALAIAYDVWRPDVTERGG